MTTVSDVAGYQTQSAASSTTPGIGKEFESFIRLLTAQIRNQDPLPARLDPVCRAAGDILGT